MGKRAVLFSVALAICLMATYLFVPFPYYENDYSQINSEAYLILDGGSYYFVYPEGNIHREISEFTAQNLIQGGMRVTGEQKY